MMLDDAVLMKLDDAVLTMLDDAVLTMLDDALNKEVSSDGAGEVMRAAALLRSANIRATPKVGSRQL
eukprot:766915-Hanusia_phi.AAC.10